MIKIRKIIYWHFAIYAGDAETINPESLPNDSISTLDMGLNVDNPIIVNGSPNVRAFSASTGYEWLIDISVANGITRDSNDDDKRTTIRSNNPNASPGFVWFDLAVVELKAVLGNPIVVDTLEQLSLVKDDNNDGARVQVKYVLFGAHKEGETGAQLRNEPNAFFDATNIPNEVSSEGDQTHQQLVDAMSSKTFVDEDGVPNSFFINIKYQEEVTKIGCCNIDVSESSSSSSEESSSSSSEESSSSSSSSSTLESCSSGLTLRSQPSIHNDRRRIWAVRQTADVNISNNAIYEGNFFLGSGQVVRKNYIASELVYADVEDVLNGEKSWNEINWQHAGYISFRENKPYAMALHKDPIFNKSDLSHSDGNLCTYHAYDNNFDLPVSIQSISWDTRGYLWALCSGGAKDSTPVTSNVVNGIESTEGVYGLIPGGWKKYPADMLYFGGSNTGTSSEYEDLNSSSLTGEIFSMSWGCDRDKKNEFLSIIDSDLNISIRKNKNSNINFPEDDNIIGDDGTLLKASSIYSGIEKICIIELDTKLPYLLSYNSVDSDLKNAIDIERSNNTQYSYMSCGIDFIVGITSSSQVKIFVNRSGSEIPSQDDADDLQEFINDDISNGYSVKKLVCGDSFFAVYLSSSSGASKLYARGYINGVSIWDGSDYDSSFIKYSSWDLSETKPILDIDAFGSYLIVVYSEGLSSSSNKSVYYTVSTVLSDLPIHNTSSASSSNTVDFIDYEFLNQLRKIYLDNTSNVIDEWANLTTRTSLISSKGLLGYNTDIYSNNLSGKINIFENSEYLTHPYFAQSQNIESRMQVDSGMFGYDVSSFVWQNESYLAISAPTEGSLLGANNGGILGQQNGQHGRGAIYIFKRYDKGFKVIQKIQHPDANAIAFGKQICLFATKDASDTSVMSLVCSYRGNTSDYTRIYYWNDVDQLFEWSELSDGLMTVGGLNLDPSTTDVSIFEIKRISDISISISCFTNNNKTGYAQFINTSNNITLINQCSGSYVKLSSFNNLSFGARFGLSCVYEPTVGGVTVAVGYPTFNSAYLSSSIISFIDSVEEDSLEIKPPDNALIQQGNGAVMLFYLNGALTSFESDVNGPLYKIIEGSNFNPNVSTKPYFGYDIDADYKHIVISSPYDTGYSAVGESSNIQEGGSVRVFEFNQPSALGERDVFDASQSIINLNSLSQFNVPQQVYQLGGGAYSLQWQKKKFGKFVKLISNKILISACDDDLVIGPSAQSGSYGNVFMLDKNKSGTWSFTGCYYDAHKGDRFGHKIEVLSSSPSNDQNDFIAFISAPGNMTSAKALNGFSQNAVVGNTDYRYGAGIVKSVVVSGSKALGILPSRIPSVLVNQDDNVSAEYFIKSSALGLKHVAHDISSSVANSRYVWKYYPARLLEKSAIKTSINENSIPSFKLGKFIKDPVFAEAEDFASTYSDIGAFTLSNTASNVSDISIANLSLYDKENLNIRVMEMHPRPYRTVDASMSSPDQEDSAAANLPQQIRSDYFDFATPTFNELNDNVYLYAPIISPQSDRWRGSIDNTNSFAIAPVRANRWIVPISKISNDNYSIFIDGIAVWNPTSASVEYNISGGYYFNSSPFIRSSTSPHTDVTGNPLIKPYNGTINSGFWWSTRNYISPGCVQLVDSSTEGHMVVWPNFNLPQGTSSANTNWGASITSFSGTENFYLGKLSIKPGALSSDKTGVDACKIDKGYFWGLKLADGSYNVFINAYNTSTSVTGHRLHQTSKYLTWSGCTVAEDRNTNSTEYSSVYTGYMPSYESYDFNLGHILSYPPINFRCSTGNTRPYNQTLGGASTIDAIKLAPNGSTHALYLNAVGWNNTLMNVGVKDIIIHGHYNYHGFQKSNNTGDTNQISTIADRRSQIVTFVSGYGSKIYSINGNNNGPSYFAPSIKFTCILDQRLSSYKSWKNNFGGLADWNTSGNPYSAWGKVAKNPSHFANSFTNNPSWVTNSYPNSFNARVAPTDTMYMVDLFWDYDPDSNTPSPSQIRAAIFSSNFEGNFTDVYDNMLLPKKTERGLAQSDFNLFPIRAYPLNRNQLTHLSCTVCPQVLHIGEAVFFTGARDPQNDSATAYDDSRSAYFSASQNLSSSTCSNALRVEYNTSYINIVSCKTFTDGIGLVVGSNTNESGVHLSSFIGSSGLGSSWCSSSSSSYINNFSYKYKTILYPSITSIDHFRPSAAGFSYWDNTGTSTNTSLATVGALYNGGGPSLLQWYSHFASVFTPNGVSGPESNGTIGEYAPTYYTLQGSYNLPYLYNASNGNSISFWSRYRYNNTNAQTLLDKFPATLNGLVGNYFATNPVYPKLGKHSSFKYPYKTNMLTGRGRNVQVSVLGAELRSISRDEIVYQNEFIYRKLSYHRQNSSGTVNESGAEFSPVHSIDTVGSVNASASNLGSYVNNQNTNGDTWSNDATNIVSLNISNRLSPEDNSNLSKSHIREEYQTDIATNTVNGDQISKQYRRFSLFDRVSPKDFFNNPETLVCLPTFGMPDLLDFAVTVNSFTHIFGLVNTFSDMPSGDYPDSGNVGAVGFTGNLTTNDKNNLGYNVDAGKQSAFWKAIKNGLAHVIDVNSSVISTSQGQRILTVTILASLNGNTWSANSPSKHSFGWKNNISTQNIFGGGLICAVITAKLDINGEVSSVKSTFANSEATLSGSIKRSTVGTGPQVLPETSWCRMGIWLQPLLGTRKISKDNSPHYWPGNFPWSASSDIKYLGVNPGDQATSSTNYFHTSPGMIKVPINRSYMIKLGKHIMLKYNSGSGSEKYFAVIGPCVYRIENDELDKGPLWWANQNKSSCFKMPQYVWDSRPIVFQKFGLSFTDMSTINSANALFAFSAYSGEAQRMVQSFFRNDSYTQDFGANLVSEFAAYGTLNGGGGSQFPPNEQWFDYNSETEGFRIPVGVGAVNNSVAILGEGVGFNVSEGSKIHAFVFWRNAFYKIEPSASATSKKPKITQIPIIATYQDADGNPDSIATQLESAYSLHRLNGFFNGNDRFVITGNSGNDSSGAFTYVFKFKSNGQQDADFFTGPGMVYESKINDMAVTGINDLCNQSFKYQVWMSNDASIIAIGNHRWDAQADEVSPNGEPLPALFYIDLYKKQVTGSSVSYTKLLEQGLSPSSTSNGAPVDVFCSAIWGVANGSNNSLYDIYVCSGIDPDTDYLDYLDSNTANYNASNFERRLGRVTVFTASIPSGNGAVKRTIELSDIVPPTDPTFSENNKSFANLNFWTMTPVSAKNGSCGLMFYNNTLVASSLGHLMKMSPSNSQGSGWNLDSIVGGSPVPNVSVKRVLTPYSQYGYVGNTNNTNNITYADNSDISVMSTVSVPTVNASASPGFNKLASKIAFIELSIDNNPYRKIFSISNYTSLVVGNADVSQVGVFDVNEDMSSSICYPAYSALSAKRFGYTSGQPNPETQIYNPSIKSWIYAYDLSSSLGDGELQYSGYEYTSDNEAHILVKPPVPDIEKKQFYFGGNEFLPLDGNNVYRDYHNQIDQIKGTLMQMDWNDVSGILWWGTNDIYVMRSYKYDQHYSPSTSDILLENYAANKTYYKSLSLGIQSVNKNAMVKFSMPNNSNQLVANPACGDNDYIGTSGCGLTGPKVITVSAVTNYGTFDLMHQNFTSIIPLLRSREKLGLQRCVVVLNDFTDHMNEQIYRDSGFGFNNVIPFYNYSASKFSNPYRDYALDMFIDDSMSLLYSKSALQINQGGFSMPNISIPRCEGNIVFARKSVYGLYNTKWNYLIKDFAGCFDPNHGCIYNGDRMLLIKLSYIYEDSVSASHPEAEWYFAPVLTTISNADVPDYKPSMGACVCSGEMRNASRKVSKWKMNGSSGGNDKNLLDIITVGIGDTSPAPIRNKINTSSSENSSVKDLVLCGKISSNFINYALNKTGSANISELMTKIKNSLYDVIEGQKFMDPAGCIHIVDTDSSDQMDNVKEEFMRKFMNTFNGFYHIIRGA